MVTEKLQFRQTKEETTRRMEVEKDVLIFIEEKSFVRVMGAINVQVNVDKEWWRWNKIQKNEQMKRGGDFG